MPGGGVFFADGGSEGVMVTSSISQVSSVNGTAGFVLTANAAGVSPSFQAASSPSHNFTYTAVSTSPYIVLLTDEYLGVNSSGGPIVIRFPNSVAIGDAYFIKDSTGSTAINNITITTVGGVVTFDGSTSYIMNTVFESINIIFNGTSYEIF